VWSGEEKEKKIGVEWQKGVRMEGAASKILRKRAACHHQENLEGGRRETPVC